ncbi:MAG: ATP-binding cassette domain-containing protein [Rikenella sp.]|nr:ATP-binding cassette domain-containing protein [Rikenella sp.]
MEEVTIRLTDAVLSEGGYEFASPLNFRLEEGEQVAVVGENGSGKSALIETLLGRRALRSGRLTYGFASGDRKRAGGGMRYIAFHETYNRAEDGEYYYQQRWNSCDNENAPRVGELLDRIETADPAFRKELYDLLAIHPMLDKPVVLLSSGELRKFQIVRMLLTQARVLAVDNPFIGLDTEARAVMNELLGQLTAMEGLQLILVLSDEAEIPDFITHIYRLEDRQLGPKIPASLFRRPSVAVLPPAIALPAPEREPLTCEEAVRLRGVTIRYGDRTILDALDWTVRNGERWALAGPNGSGKSTLLSLICADNPQAYAQDITLFGRQRGTGESIWEIKRRIGYVSAEMHRSFLKPIPAVNLAASGYFDSLGLYETPTAEQLTSAEAWMEVFGIGAVADRSFLRLSSGEQRLVLLARAFVKDPDLLILDEPLNGLDQINKARVRAIVEAFCGRPGKSLIYVSHVESDLPSCIDRRLELRRNG